MGEADDAKAMIAEMLEHSDAQRHPEAIASARQVLGRARGFEHQGIKAVLLAQGASTLLTSEAVVDPDDLSLIERCDRIFELYGKAGSGPMDTTAITALGVKIGLLLRARQPRRAEETSEMLASFYAERPAGKYLAQQSAEVVRVALNMIAMRSPVAATSLARRVVERLGSSDAFDDQVIAATAQAWVVIATMMRTDKAALGFPDPPATAPELREIIDGDDPAGYEPAGEEPGTLIAMGEAAVTALEALIPRLAGYGPDWDSARFLMMMLTVAMLRDLGRHDEAHAAEEAVVEQFSDGDDWRYQEFMRWIRHDLDTPSDL